MIATFQGLSICDPWALLPMAAGARPTMCLPPAAVVRDRTSDNQLQTFSRDEFSTFHTLLPNIAYASSSITASDSVGGQASGELITDVPTSALSGSRAMSGKKKVLSLDGQALGVFAKQPAYRDASIDPLMRGS